MPYHPIAKKKFIAESFSALKIEGTNFYYYYPKIVGVTYPCSSDPLATRGEAIKDFFEAVGNRFSFIHNQPIYLEFKDSIKQASFSPKSYSIESFVRLVRETDNTFDPNAISVRIKRVWRDHQFLDIGYLPSSHAEILKDRFSSRTVVGVERDGRGMRLHIILQNEEELADSKPIEKSLEEIIVTPNFLSLKKIRQALEVSK